MVKWVVAYDRLSKNDDVCYNATKKSLERNKIPTFEQVDIEHAFGGARLIDKIAIDGSDLNVEILPSATKHGQRKDGEVNERKCKIV